MRIKGIEHVSINVSEMGASLAFYGEVLGLERLQTVPEEGFSITYFALPDGGRLELFDYGGKTQGAPDLRARWDSGTWPSRSIRSTWPRGSYAPRACASASLPPTFPSSG